MTLAAGTRLGPYEIVTLIGAGGMGEVYRARDTQLKRDVALKILPADHALDLHLPTEPGSARAVSVADRLARFEREACALAALNHPHIAQVYGLAHEAGTPGAGPGDVRAIVMELVEGQTLAERIARGAVPLDEALPLAVQLAEAVEYAHERGIVHRDLKPANIKLTPDGAVKVLDFGLAKVLVGDAGGSATDLLGNSPTMTSPAMSQLGVILGTAAYMAPEQARGTAVDKRADIWAFGVVLFEMLTGRACFDGETVTDVLAAVMRAEPDWARLPVATPPRVRELLERCLARDRRQRLHDIGDARLELEKVLAVGRQEDGVPAAREAVAETPGRTRRSWAGRTAALLALAALAFVVGGATVLSLLGDSGPNLDNYRLTPFATAAEPEGSPAWSPDGGSLAYTKTVDGRSQVFVRTLGVDAPTRVTSLSADASGPVWTPDAARILFLSGGNLWSVSPAGGEPEIVQKEVRAASLSPDGKTLALWRTTTDGSGTLGTVWTATPPTAAPREYQPAPFAVKASLTPTYLRFSPDGRNIAAAFYNLDRQSELWELPFPGGPGANPQRHFFAGTSSARNVARPAWMPDGRRLVLGLGGALTLGDFRQGTVRTILRGATAASAPDVAPNGRRIAFVSGRTDYDVVEIPLDGSPMRDVLATSQNEHAPVWIPRTSSFAYVASRDGQMQIRMHNQAEGWDRPIVTPVDFGGVLKVNLRGLSPSPDATRIAYCGPDSMIWISPIAGGTPIKAVPSFFVTWSPDGKWLAYLLNNRLVKSRVGSSDAPLALTGPRTFRTAAAEVGGAAVRPLWSPTGEAIVFQEPEGVMLVGADGRNERLLTPLKTRVLGWSIDGATVYAVPINEVRDRLVSIDARSGTVRTVSTFDDGVRVEAFSTGSAILSPSRDGKSLLTSVERTKTDIWILDGFDTRRGLFDWWKP